MPYQILNEEEYLNNLRNRKYKQQSSYKAMFSTWISGIVVEPHLMQIPIDDHQVHRGDAVFEAIKVVNGQVYLMEAHLARLKVSSDKLSIPWPISKDELKEGIFAAIQASGLKTSMIRMYLSRGPGGFTTNPYDSCGSQFYVVITDFAPMPKEKYANGVKVAKSQIPVKEAWMAQVKSCNYLPNVMMKKEAVDQNLDFTIGFDLNGFIAEGSTENIALIDADNNYVHPDWEFILKGTTMIRAGELAVKAGICKAVVRKSIAEKDIFAAKEVFMVGTTLDILPVTSFDGKPIAGGQVGEICKKLLKIVEEDQKGSEVTVSIE